MKIANIELTGERLLAASGVAALAAIILIYSIFYMPLIKKLRTAYRECRLCEMQVSDARRIIEHEGKVGGDRMLMTEKEVSTALDELAKHGSLKSGAINFRSIKPGEIIEEKGSPYKIMPVEMNIYGKDRNIADFIGSLDLLKKGVIKIRSLDIVPDKNDRTNLKANMVVDMYISGRPYE